MDTFAPIFGVECKVCEASPCVGIREPEPPFNLRCSELCGICHFGDRAMVDYELWNEQPESTE